ncbi:484_t:CDS:1, partial [Racocetra fulgida]
MFKTLNNEYNSPFYSILSEQIFDEEVVKVKPVINKELESESNPTL